MYGLAEGFELFLTQGHGDRFLRELVSPLKPRTRFFESGTIHDRALADIADVDQLFLQAFIFLLPSGQGNFFHAVV